MLDEEKDLFIKNKLQRDKTISSKVNDVFKNFESQYLTSNDTKSKNTDDKETKSKDNVITLKTHNFFKRMVSYTAVAASFVVAISVGAGVAIYNNVNGNKGKANYSTVNIDNPSTASDYTVAEVKNEEVKVEQNVEKKVSENSLIKAVLTNDGSVAIQLKKEFLDYHKLKADTTKMYKVSKINGKVKDIFVCSMVSKEIPYVLLLMENGNVDVIQILTEETANTESSNYKFDFYDQGKIEGLSNVVRFEQKNEPIVDSDKEFYYVNAILTDGTKKQIDSIEKVDMNDVSKNRISYSCQDQTKAAVIYSDKGNYVQTIGEHGGSSSVYYINDNCLYRVSLVDGSEEKLATGIESVKLDDNIVIAKLKFTSFIHRNCEYVKYEQYNVTESKVIDQKEDENFIVCLKADGSITVEMKAGSKNRTGAKEYFRENYIYNFYADDYNVHVYNEYSNFDSRKQGSNYYSNATAIYLDEIGTKGTKYLVFATKNKEIVIVDLYYYVKDANGGSFESEPGQDRFVVSSGIHSYEIDELNSVDLKVKFENGSTKECKSVEVTYTNGTKNIIPSSPILNKEGYTGQYTFVNE